MENSPSSPFFSSPAAVLLVPARDESFAIAVRKRIFHVEISEEIAASRSSSCW